jgi:hypothetical protein
LSERRGYVNNVGTVNWFVQKLKGFTWVQWAVLAAFLLIAGLTGWHAFHTVRRAIYWSHHRDEPIRGWMTVGYVAHSYRVPSHVLYEALGLPDRPVDQTPGKPHKRQTLHRIAREQHRSLDDIKATLENAIQRARSPQAAPSPSPSSGASP